MKLQLAHTDQAVTDRPGTAAAARRPIRVVLADDHPAVRRGVRRLIGGQPDMRVVADARMAEEALGYLEEPDDVAVVDYHLGGGREGLWVTRRLKRLPIPPRVLMYSAFADSTIAVAAHIAGADGLLGKGSLGEELCATIRSLAAGGQHLPVVPARLADTMRSRVLPEHQATFEMLLAGVPSGVIEERLAVSRDELEDWRGMILRALTVTAEAAGQAGAPVPYRHDSDLRNAHVLTL